LAYAFSARRSAVNWRLVGMGLGIQAILAILILRGDTLSSFFSPLGWPQMFFKWVSGFFVLVLQFTEAGSRIIFGDLAAGPGSDGSLGFFFAFQVLPTIVFFASLTTLLYHYGVLQAVVRVMAVGMQKVMGTSGAESLSMIANIFVGQTEAPLVVKPYVRRMTSSELFAVMTGGMATIAGGVMATYIMMLGDAFAASHSLTIEAGRQLFAEQLLGASLMAAPAALVIAKILYPEVDEPETRGTVKVDVAKTDANGIDAAATGAADGLRLALNVGAMLLAFFALLAMLNHLVGYIGGLPSMMGAFVGFDIPVYDLTIQGILGWFFAPVAYLIGIPWAEASDVGAMIGTKLVLTEYIAYISLAEAAGSGILSERTIFMTTFALCGFANFTSIAIQIGGIGGIAPDRKSELAKFGVKAVLAGSLANLMTATYAGMLY
jgi:concentrative nucleoside transporter, CNT family